MIAATMGAIGTEMKTMTAEEAKRAHDMLIAWQKEHGTYREPSASPVPQLTPVQVEMAYQLYAATVAAGRVPGPLMSKEDWVASSPPELDPKGRLRTVYSTSPISLPITPYPESAPTAPTMTTAEMQASAGGSNTIFWVGCIAVVGGILWAMSRK